MVVNQPMRDSQLLDQSMNKPIEGPTNEATNEQTNLRTSFKFAGVWMELNWAPSPALLCAQRLNAGGETF